MAVVTEAPISFEVIVSRGQELDYVSFIKSKMHLAITECNGDGAVLSNELSKIDQEVSTLKTLETINPDKADTLSKLIKELRSYLPKPRPL